MDMNEEAIDHSLENDEPEYYEVFPKDIDIRDHCEEKGTWADAIGYLMYAANFPTRMDIADITNAMEIVFPERSCVERLALKKFWEHIIGFREQIYKLDQDLQAQLIDERYYNFAKNIRRWLTAGVEEPENPDTKIKDNRIFILEEKKIVSRKLERIEDPFTRKVWYKKIRQCPRCGKKLKYQQRFCSTQCRFEDPNVVREYVVDEEKLLKKYFPNAHTNGS